MQAAFLQMQQRAQHMQFASQDPPPAETILLLGEQPIGRLVVTRRPGEVYLNDISLLPAFRNQGLGTALLRQLQAEAAGSRAILGLHVRADNPPAACTPAWVLWRPASQGCTWRWFGRPAATARLGKKRS